MTKNKTTMLLTAWGGVIIASVVMVTGCFSPLEQGESEIVSEEGSKVFTFHVKGDFGVSYDEMTRAAVRLEDDNTAGITDLWVLDYQNEGTDDVPQWKLVQQVHQIATDEGFGHPQMALTYGQHSMKLIASKGETPTLTATDGTVSSTESPHQVSWTKVKDTFVLDYPVTVSASSNGNRAPELQRAVAAVTLEIADAVPASAKVINITMERSLKLDLPSLTAGAASEGTVTLNVPASWAGQTGKSASVYTLNTGEDVTTDVTVTVLDGANNVITEVIIADVPVKRNQQTKLKGSLFGSDEGFAIGISQEWGDDIVVEF